MQQGVPTDFDRDCTLLKAHWVKLTSLLTLDIAIRHVINMTLCLIFFQISTNVMKTLVRMAGRVIVPSDRLSAYAQLDTTEIRVKMVRSLFTNNTCQVHNN